MKQRNLIAKKNLKRALYLGGGMAVFTAAIGLAVSIPVYNSIQKELAKKVSNLSDLSSFMSQLTAKLGVPEDSEFRTELAGGYEVVYSNGKTSIYKSGASGKSLILNMNADGSVGSAAQLQGPAAQSMLGVIQNAHDTMASDAAAMDDILGPFVDSAEETSLAMEAATTGYSEETLKARNALAGVNLNDQAAVDRAISKITNGDSKINAAALELAEAQAAEAKRQRELKAAQDKAATSSNKDAALKELKDLEVKNAKSWLDDHKPNAIEYVGLSDDEILSLKEKTFSDDLKSKQAEIDKIRKEAADRAAAALKLASARQDYQQMNHISSGGSSNVLIKIAQSIPSTAKVLMNAMFGYIKPGETNISPANNKVKTMLEEEVIKQGMSRKTLEEFEKLLDEIHDSMGSNWKDKVIGFNILANTYSYKEASISKMFVLNAIITNPDDSSAERVYVGKTTDASPRDFQGNKLKLVDPRLNNNIKDMAAIIAGNTNIVLSKTAALGIMDFINEKNTFKKVYDQSQFAEMQKLAIKATSAGDVHQAIINKFLLDMGKRYLIEGKNIKINSSLISKMIDQVLIVDGTTENNYETQGAPTKSPLDFVGKLTKIILKKSDKDEIRDYEGFARGISDVINISEFSSNKEKVNELVDMMKTYDSLDYLEGVKELLSSKVGLSFFESQSKFEVIKKQLVNGDQVNKIKKIVKIISDKNSNIFLSSANEADKIFSLKNPDQIIKDFDKYLKIKGIDLTDPSVMDQVIASSAVTAKLATHTLDPLEEEAVDSAMSSLIAAKTLSAEEFKIVSIYTEIVFKVFKDPNEAAKQLQKVMDPAIIKSQIKHIDTFNKWVAAIERSHPGETITKEMIEKYVWTKDIVETSYESLNGSEKVSSGYMIVSAAYNDKDGKTYFVDHKSTGGGDTRDVATLEHKDGKTIVKRYDRDPDKSAPEDIQRYISGQTIHEGKLYWIGLNDDPSAASSKAGYLYIYDIKTKSTKTVKLTHDGTAEANILGNIRMLTWANGKLYGGVGNNDETEKEFIEIDPVNGKYTYLGKDKGYTSFTDQSQGVYTWTSGAFTVDGETYVISPTRLKADHSKSWLTITKVRDGHEDQVEIDGLDPNWDTSLNAVGMIVGNYDSSTHIQTIFYVDSNGGVVKLGIKIDPITKDPKIDLTKTLVLIGKDKPNYGTRGTTFVDGAITVYGSSKAVYISDQTRNLNDIFKFLMEH